MLHTTNVLVSNTQVLQVIQGGGHASNDKLATALVPWTVQAHDSDASEVLPKSNTSGGFGSCTCSASMQCSMLCTCMDAYPSCEYMTLHPVSTELPFMRADPPSQSMVCHDVLAFHLVYLATCTILGDSEHCHSSLPISVVIICPIVWETLNRKH